MARFGIVTPTIGREALKRCVMSLEHQVFKDYTHIVVGDGPQQSWVGEFCAAKGIKYFETPIKDVKKSYGAAPRNMALDVIESTLSCDYVIFLDDDNVLLEPTLYQANVAANMNGNPQLMYQDILFTSKYREEYQIFPVGPVDPDGRGLAMKGNWDLLNGIYRSDVIRGVRFQKDYINDHLFASDVLARIDDPRWLKIKGVGGIHHLSWDTYDG